MEREEERERARIEGERGREGDAEIGMEGRKREAWQAFRGQFDQQQEQPGSPFSQLRHILLSPPPSEAAMLPTGRNIGRVKLNWPKKCERSDTKITKIAAANI
jgi:hypothetical protein